VEEALLIEQPVKKSVEPQAWLFALQLVLARAVAQAPELAQRVQAARELPEKRPPLAKPARTLRQPIA
jgi:hypothetical protein